MARGVLLVAAFLLIGGLVPLPTASAAESKPLGWGLPQGIVGAPVVQVGDALYMLGGRFSDYTLSDEIVRIDPATGANQTVAHFPDVSTAPGSPQRYAGAASVFNGKIYYFGGATTVQANLGGQTTTVPKPVPDIVVYDPAQPVGLANPRIVNAKLPAGEWGMGLALVGSNAYLFGGFTLDFTPTITVQRHDWVLKYDFAADKITTQTRTLPYELQDPATVYLTTPSAKVYLFGGLASNNTNNECPGYYVQNQTSGQQEWYVPPLCLTNRIVRWDPVLGESEVLADTLPFRVQYMQAGVVRGGKAYLMGGVLVDQSASGSVFEWNPSASTPLRSLVPTLSPTVFGAGTYSDGSTVLLLGGRSSLPRNSNDHLVNTVQRFDPNPTAPRPPTGLAAERAGTAIHLSWQPPTYDGDSPVTGYRVTRTDAEGTELLLTPQPIVGLSLDDTATKAGANYTYKVLARNSIGESAPAVLSTATATTVPGVVTSFRAEAGNGEAVLSWKAPTTTGGLDLSGYRVYRDGGSTPVASLAPSQLAYTDTGLTNGVEYAYSVRAVNAKGEGPASPALRVTPAPKPDAPTFVDAKPVGGSASTASSVEVSWVPPSSQVDRFVVLRGEDPDAITREVGNVSSINTTFTDASVFHGRTYYYAVRSYSPSGLSLASNVASVSLVNVPGAPTNVRAAGLEGLVQLTWDSPNDLGDAPPSAITYVVQRFAPGSTRGTIVSPPDLADTSFADKTASPGILYSYQILTQNPRRSDPSETVTASAKVVPNKPPVAALDVLPAIAVAGDPVTLDASQSVDPDGSIVEYVFNFGDGTDPVRSTSATATHQYATNGSYDASVVVTDNRGNLSAPSSSRVIVGELVGSGTPSTGVDLPGKGGTSRPSTAAQRPGSSSGKLLPGFEPALLALAAVGGALAVTRRHRSR